MTNFVYCIDPPLLLQDSPTLANRFKEDHDYYHASITKALGRTQGLCQGVSMTNFVYCIDPHLLLPDSPTLANRFKEDHDYYHVLGFMADLIRSKESSCSIYQGEDFNDPLMEFLSGGIDDRSYDFVNLELQVEMLRRASLVETLAPPGIFEHFDVAAITPRGIYFRGIVHATDYR